MEDLRIVRKIIHNIKHLIPSHPVCRYQKRQSKAVSGVGAPRLYCTPMLWHCTSSRSPWLMGSRLRRSNNRSSFQASQANSSLIPSKQKETGRLPIAAALASAHAARALVTRMVRLFYCLLDN